MIYTQAIGKVSGALIFFPVLQVIMVDLLNPGGLFCRPNYIPTSATVGQLLVLTVFSTNLQDRHFKPFQQR